MVLSTEWSQVEVIDLVNDGNGLGFMLVGGRSTGVVIKGLIPGGVAERDGRLQSGDHVLQIGDINLRGFCSEQVASVLRQNGTHVRLLVARPFEPGSTDYQTLTSHAPIIPTKLLSDPDELTRQLYQNPTFAASAGFMPNPDEILQIQQHPPQTTLSASILPPLELIAACPAIPITTNTTQSSNFNLPLLLPPIIPILSPDSTQSLSPNSNNCPDTPETETYQVELRKNVYGLGITVAGYVCEEEDLSGIFVKSIIEGSAAEMSRQIQINDRIIAVDGKCLNNVTNHQAVDILRNTDIIVMLTLERFLRGRKYEHLQVALTETKYETQSPQASLPASPSIATLSWVPAKSDVDSIVTENCCDDDHDHDGECNNQRRHDEIIIECELASHTTLDSNMSMVLDNCCDEHSYDDDDDDDDDDDGNNCDEILKNSNNNSNENSNSCDDINNVNNINFNKSSDKFHEIHKTNTTTTTTNGKKHLQNGDNSSNASNTSSSGSCSLKNSRNATPTPSIDSLKKTWQQECPESDIIVADINKLAGLGISLEGTVDVECGIEKRPHHYIRSILQDGPVALHGKLKPGDEILQVNDCRLQGLRHTEVVKILKELPCQVKLVCARGPTAPSVINTSQNPEAFETRSLLPGGHQSLQGLLLTKAQSESSLYTSSTATLTDQQRSKSVEQVSGLALWTSEIIYIDIEKTDRGFGFSILDYQDPLDPDGTVIVIRGLIPGGSAEATNQIYPGDRLVSVADHNLQAINLDDAVNILKGMPNGETRIGICRPLSTSDNNIASTSPVDSNST